MLNYQNIISHLEEERKIKFITDIVSLDDSVLGVQQIPKIKVGYVDNYLKDLYPKLSVLSFSLDRKLWQKVASQIALKMKNDGVNFAVSYGPKPKLNPLSISEISEDLLINVELATIFAKELKKVGIVVGLDNLYLKKEDLAFVDAVPNRRFLAEAFIKPYLDVLNSSGAFTIIAHFEKLNGKYKGVNEKLQNTVIEELNKQGKAFLVSVESQPENTVKNINDGIILFKGSDAMVVSAVKDGHKLEEEIKNDTIDVNLIDREIINGKVITSNLLDESVDRALDFLFSCSNITSTKTTNNEYNKDLNLSKESVLKSMVLLKNQSKLLPLKSGATVSLIGDLGCIKQQDGLSVFDKLKDSLSKNKINVINVLKGYDINVDRSEKLLSKVESSVKNSDVAVVFLGLNDKLGKEYSIKNRGELPANQTALIHRLLNYKEKVIIVLCSDYLVNFKLIENFPCVLLSPISQITVASALLDVFTKKYSPNGKLTSTIYDNFERVYLKKADNLARGMKVGPLFGYREYSSIGLFIDNSFGYGLSLSKVKYKRIKLKKDKLGVKVKLKNKSKIAIDKVVEAYIGLCASDKVEPKLTLAGFERVYIKPRSKKKIFINLTMPYTYLEKEYKTFDNKYQVYLGNCCQSVIKIKKVKNKGKVLDCKPNLDWAKEFSYTENLADYYESMSNIRENNYMLEAKRDKMKRTKKNLIVALGSIVMAVAILMFNSLSKTGALFLNIVAGILGLTAIAFFILDISDRNKAYKKECKKVDDANKKLFVGAKKIPTFNAEKMFNDEFKDVTSTKEEKVEDKKVKSEEEDLKFVNKNLNFSQAISNFISSASENGVIVDRASATTLFASLASSRLIVVDNMQSDNFYKFLNVASNYFGVPSFIDYVYDEYPFSYEYVGENGATIKSNVINAIESANKNKEKIHLIGLDNVKISNFKEYFEPFNKYIFNPKKLTKGVALGSSTYDIPNNVWFIINVSSQDNIKNFDLDLARGICIDSFSVLDSEVQSEQKEYPLFTSQQLNYLATKTVESVVISEDVWKKLDKFESFATELNGTQFGNKLVRAIEKHVAILAENDNTVNEAVDMTLASKIAPFMFIELKEFNLKEEGVMDALDKAFGEDNVTYAHSKIENYSYYSNQKVEEPTENYVDESEYANYNGGKYVSENGEYYAQQENQEYYAQQENQEYYAEQENQEYINSGEEYAEYYSEENYQE